MDKLVSTKRGGQLSVYDYLIGVTKYGLGRASKLIKKGEATIVIKK